MTTDPSPCCNPAGLLGGSVKVEAVVSVDERGQMVLPKELRDRAGIRPGDKLAIVSVAREGQTCCLSLVRCDDLAGLVKGFLGPVMQELAR